MNEKTKTQIVATIGPSSRAHETLVAMMQNGMDVARLNFSHGTHADHAELIKAIRNAANSLDLSVPIIQDLSGPRLVTSDGHHLDPNSVEVITDKDKTDLLFGLEQKVDYIALSFVREAADILTLQALIHQAGANTPIIAKIERKEALDVLEEIIAVADGVMVARGDLGDNVPIERLPFIERDIINIAKRHDKPVITATQMMLSMVNNPLPTRAEVTDVAYAVLLGSDAVMLSEESANGRYPVEAVSIMDRIIREAESQHTTHQLA